MKYVIVLLDGASGWPLPEYGGRTSLETAHTPNLDAMSAEGRMGLARTIPPGREPSSVAACLWILGYDPGRYQPGRAGIEAVNIGVGIGEGEAVFRCSLVTVADGRLVDASAGHITTAEASRLIASLNRQLGNDEITFHTGTGYRHILKLKNHPETLGATCALPHDSLGKPVARLMPSGPGSDLLRRLMEESVGVFRDHPVNRERQARGELPAAMIWLFWGTGCLPEIPSFRQVYGLKAAVTSGVDLVQGLARLTGIEVLNIPGVTDGADNDYIAQAEGALDALPDNDLVIIHIEATDESAHGGSAAEKVRAIEQTDRQVTSRLRARREDWRVLVMVDHPTPVALRTHTGDPVPFLLWGNGFHRNGAARFTEAEAASTGLFLGQDDKILRQLLNK